MSNTKKVDEFMGKLKHPLKSEMEAVIKIIRAVSPKIRRRCKMGRTKL